MSRIRRGDIGLGGNRGQFAGHLRREASGQGLVPLRSSDDTNEARLSRRLLIDTLKLLEPFTEALTIIGAHAVFSRVETALPDLEMSSTKDADVAVDPEFVAATPVIRELMQSGGLEPAMQHRPGIYGLASERDLEFEDRTTIDLIVPAVYAGGGRRTARIRGQDGAATFAPGLEFAVHCRSMMELRPLPGDPDQSATEAMVAEIPALIVAKAYKVRQRLHRYDTRPDRLRPKDSGDIGLMILASDPGETAEALERLSTDHTETMHVGQMAVRFIVSHYLYSHSSLVRRHLNEQLQDSTGNESTRYVDDWLESFDRATSSWRGDGDGQYETGEEKKYNKPVSPAAK